MAGTRKHRHACTSAPRRPLSPGLYLRPGLCDTEQRPSSSLIHLLMGNQKSVSQPADWRDELLEGTTDETQKGRRNRTAALPWIKLLARGRREDTEDNAPRAGAAPAQGDMLEVSAAFPGWIASSQQSPAGPERLYKLQHLCPSHRSLYRGISSTAPLSWAGADRAQTG